MDLLGDDPAPTRGDMDSVHPAASFDAGQRQDSRPRLCSARRKRDDRHLCHRPACAEPHAVHSSVPAARRRGLCPPTRTGTASGSLSASASRCWFSCAAGPALPGTLAGRCGASPQTVAGVWLRTTLTWVCWVRLLGVDLIVATPNGGRHAVGWLSVAVVAVLSGLGACAGLRLVQAGRRKGQLLPWTGLCLGVTLVSLASPLSEAVGTTSLAASSACTWSAARQPSPPHATQLDRRPTKPHDRVPR